MIQVDDIPGFAHSKAVPSLVIGIQANLILFNNDTGPSRVVSRVLPILSISDISIPYIRGAYGRVTRTLDYPLRNSILADILLPRINVMCVISFRPLLAL
jgi:hypothetical protein